MPARRVASGNLNDAYRYVSEAYGGYHINALDGINFEAGIFMSYVGLFSYYNFDNWAYQPSYVSSNTPWFFNGVRVQIFPTEKLKIEPWFDQRLAGLWPVQQPARCRRTDSVAAEWVVLVSGESVRVGRGCARILLAAFAITPTTASR